MKWLSISPLSLVVAAIIGLQVEIHNLAQELAKARWDSTSAAAAVEKFEKDLFANERAHQKESLAARAVEDAAQRRAIDQGLSGLPVGNFRSPVYWQSPTPTQK
jgi:hypothetical protein